jgi:hypothetical protein
VRVVRAARRPSTNASRIEPPPVMSQPPNESVPYCANTAGSMNTPEPTMMPTVSDQQAQNPNSLSDAPLPMTQA